MQVAKAGLGVGGVVKLILETAAKYGVPVDMLWKPSGGSGVMQPALTPPPVRESGVPAKS